MVSKKFMINIIINLTVFLLMVYVDQVLLLVMIENEHKVNVNHFGNYYIPVLYLFLSLRKQAMDDLGFEKIGLLVF
jgi:hypothetical protein